MMNDSTPIRSKYMDYKLVREQGNIYWKMGDKLKAAEFYYDYIAATDSVRTKRVAEFCNRVFFYFGVGAAEE